MINLDAFDAFAATVLVVLVVIIPLTGLKEFDLLDRWIGRGRKDARLRFYYWVMAFEWVLTLSLLAWWFWLGRGAQTLGLVPIASQWQWLGVVAGLVLTYLAILQMNMVLDNHQDLRKVQGSLGKLAHVAPRTEREQGVFLQLSFTAGICEEILYRGFLMQVLTAATGGVTAFFLVAMIFGLGHAYQGRDGILKTGAVGLVFGGLAVLSGSLVVGMVLHAVLDLTSGRLMQAALSLGQPLFGPDPDDN